MAKVSVVKTLSTYEEKALEVIDKRIGLARDDFLLDWNILNITMVL